MVAIHQFLAGFSRADAISNEAIVLRDLFRSWGAASEIYSEGRRILPELRSETRDIRDAAATIKPEDIVFHHLSIGSVVNEVFGDLSCRKAMLYHNITPPEYFYGVQEEIARNLALGREQARRLAGVAEVNLADSRYNAHELSEMGYGEVAVLPLVLDLERVRAKPDARRLRELNDGLTNILAVGRVVPNKRLEDALHAFYYFQRYVQPESRLILAGSYAGVEGYQAYLLTLIRELRLNHVLFTGSIRQPDLNACYRASHVFLCMSEHEGFCIPVLEAMATELPVLAHAAAAVPDTMDGAGVLFHQKRFDLIAEMMGRLAAVGPLRNAIIADQTARIQRYESRDLAQELRQHLAPLLN